MSGKHYGEICATTVGPFRRGGLRVEVDHRCIAGSDAGCNSKMQGESGFPRTAFWLITETTRMSLSHFHNLTLECVHT